MSGHTMIRKQVLPGPPTTVFAFCTDPAIVVKILPKWLGSQLLSPVPLVIRRGVFIEYLFRPLYLPIHWVSHVTFFDAPRMIVLEQFSGPFALWRDTREFRRVKLGTEVIDTIHYELPLGPLGRLLQRSWAGGALERILDDRLELLQSNFPQALPPDVSLGSESR